MIAAGIAMPVVQAAASGRGWIASPFGTASYRFAFVLCFIWFLMVDAEACFQLNCDHRAGKHTIRHQHAMEYLACGIRQQVLPA
jgi:hypothetical protein